MHDLEERERRLNDLQKEIQEVRNRLERESRNSRETINRRDLDINERNSII